MVSIGKSLFLAVISLFNRRMIWLMIWPVLVSLVLWGIVGFALWVKTAAWIAGQLARLAEPLTAYIPYDFSSITLFSAHVMLILLSERHYPALARRHGGGTAGSVWNGVVALCGMVLLFLVTLPLMLIPPLWAIVPVAVMAWVNQKLLRYDALAVHATPQEMQSIFSKRKGSLYTLGLVLALVAYVPVVGFFAPVLFALAFIHFGLSSLRELRDTAEPRGPVGGGRIIEGQVVG
jgi:CysZ protein